MNQEALEENKDRPHAVTNDVTYKDECQSASHTLGNLGSESLSSANSPPLSSNSARNESEVLPLCSENMLSAHSGLETFSASQQEDTIESKSEGLVDTASHIRPESLLSGMCQPPSAVTEPAMAPHLISTLKRRDPPLPSLDRSGPIYEEFTSIGTTSKRPSDVNFDIVQGNKKSRLEPDDLTLPVPELQPKFLSVSSAKTKNKIDEELLFKIGETKHFMEIFPGGRGVVSPIYGFKERNISSPLIELSFSTRLALDRNPFQSTSRRSGESWSSRGVLPSVRFNCEVPAISVAQTQNESVYDNPEADAIVNIGKSWNNSKTKKKGLAHKLMPLSKATFTSPKDAASAQSLLSSINGLSGVISENEAMWLGETFWIFTVEQLEHSLSSSSKSTGDDLLQGLARSVLCGNDYTEAFHHDSALDLSPLSTEQATARSPGNAESVTTPTPLHATDVTIPSEGSNHCDQFISTQGDMSMSRDDKDPPSDHFKRATVILQRWKNCIDQFRSGQSNKGRNNFLLLGPIGQLLPEVLRQFLESVCVLTLQDFLSLKKTESSPLISYYKEWRQHCALQPLKGYCLARHLYGMSIRLEKAVSSVPPVDAETRKWMSTVLVTLTGSSKEFIIDECKALDVETFLSERTKEWSDRLVKWRGCHSLPPLKGSGKVAMISGWKTSLKESLDVEKGVGRYLTEAELLKTPPREANDEEPRAEREDAGPEIDLSEKILAEPRSYTTSQLSLHSNDFLVSVLKLENVRFLNSIGIWNAEQLIECDKQPSSAAISALVNYRTNYRTDPAAHPATPATCVRLIYDWTHRVKTKLKEIRCDLSGALNKKRGPKGKEGGEPQIPFRTVAQKELTSQPNRPKSSKIVMHDPMDVLSSTSRSFLRSIEIFDANTFLGTKTSLISNAFIAWRENQKMPSLKGYGAIATISGWKAQIRKAATDIGEHSLATKEPTDRYGKRHNAWKSITADDGNPSFLDSLVVEPPIGSSLLFGMLVSRVYVQGPTGVTFAFELTVRNSTMTSGKVATFLTYLGHQNPRTTQQGVFDEDPNFDSLPILVDVADTCAGTERFERSTFSSLGEGSGVVDLGKYGVCELPSSNLEELREDILVLLDNVVEDVNCKDPNSDTRNGNAVHPANLFLLDASIYKSRQIFFQSAPLERGQVVELIPSRISITDATAVFQDSVTVVLRLKIMYQVSELTVVEVEEILRWTVEQHNSRPIIIDQTQSAVLQRRFHWLAWLFLRQMDDLEMAYMPDRSAMQTLADSLLIPCQSFQDTATSNESPEPRYTWLLDEISEELKSNLILNGGGVSPSNPMVSCKVAVTLNDECLRAASAFLLSKAPESLALQECLLQEFLALAKNATSMLMDKETPLEKLALTRRNADNESEFVIATGSSWRSPTFRTIEDVKNGGADVNIPWYLVRQILRTVHSVASCDQIPWLNTPDSMYTYDILVSAVEKSATSNEHDIISDSTPVDWCAASLYINRALLERYASVPSIPTSLPLFLGLVWPSLHSHFGWRIDAGERAEDVMFLSPGQKNLPKRHNDIVAKLKQERRNKRVNLDTKLKDVGLQDLSKLTKRIVIQANSMEARFSKPEVSVHSALEMFGAFLLSKSSSLTPDAQKHRVDAIVDGFRRCSEDIIPILTSSSSVDHTGDLATRKYGCEQLITMLIAIPSVLQQSDLSIGQIEDSSRLIKDLINFLTAHQDECFGAESRPFFESYGGNETPADIFLLSKLDERHGDSSAQISGSSHSGEENEEEALGRDLLEPNDQNDLTDYTAMAIRQMAPCRAGPNDSSKKGRKHVPVGYPGLVCVHCWGLNEGKYFFTSPESLGTACGVIYSHLARCPKFPPSELKKLTTFKGQQADARKRLKYGAQASYFSRLWKRLHSATSIAGTPEVLLHQPSDIAGDLVPKDDANDEESLTEKKSREFRNHIDLLEHIERSDRLKKDVELVAAVKLYYYALQTGGRIYMTNVMPAHFSSEWLLAKVSPVSLHKHCSGAGMPG